MEILKLLTELTIYVKENTEAVAIELNECIDTEVSVHLIYRNNQYLYVIEFGIEYDKSSYVTLTFEEATVIVKGAEWKSF